MNIGLNTEVRALTLLLFGVIRLHHNNNTFARDGFHSLTFLLTWTFI